MEAAETRSILTVALLAAFADGLKDDRERQAVKRVAEALGPEAGFDLLPQHAGEGRLFILERT